MNRSNSLGLLLVGLLTTMASTLHAEETVWFVVTKADPPVRNDSYLLPLTRPQDIADARRWLELETASGVDSIVVARVASGGDGFNRDVRAEDSQAWSWHVTEFVSFEGNTVELIDGWPGLIEADPAVDPTTSTPGSPPRAAMTARSQTWWRTTPPAAASIDWTPCRTAGSGRSASSFVTATMPPCTTLSMPDRVVQSPSSASSRARVA